MRSGVKRDIWPDQGPGTDAYLASIEADEVGVDVNVLAELEVRPIIDADGRFDPGVGR